MNYLLDTLGKLKLYRQYLDTYQKAAKEAERMGDTESYGIFMKRVNEYKQLVDRLEKAV